MAAFTEKAIKLSFMKLLNDKPINKIHFIIILTIFRRCCKRF